MKLWQEFKAFAFKGNLIELAVAVVIGTAFADVVNSLVKNVIMPSVSYIMPEGGGYEVWKLGRIEIGQFLAAIVKFLIIAWAIFLIIKKLIGGIAKRAEPATPDEPMTKECPLCLSIIPFKAVKCAQCTADLVGKPV